MKGLDHIRSKFNKAINENKVFVYDGDFIQALAFFQGSNLKEEISQIKEFAKQHGLKYNFNFECYIHTDKHDYNKYREEKDEFIDQLVSWKLHNPHIASAYDK